MELLSMSEAVIESTEGALGLSRSPTTDISGLIWSTVQLTYGARSAPTADLGPIYISTSTPNPLIVPTPNSHKPT